MASTYSTNLGIDLPANGDQSGTWGTTVNTNLGTLIEQAVSGYVTQAITDGSGVNTTITIPNGATGVARNMAIEMTGALTFSTTSLIVPANKKLYFIYNNTTGGYAVTVKVSGLTGVSVPNGRKVILVSNGTDIVEAVNAVSGNATVGGTLVVTGATTLTGAVTLSAALTYGGVTLTNAVTGTGKMVLDTSPVLVTPNIGTPSAGVISACTSTGMVLTTPVLGTPTSGNLDNCTADGTSKVGLRPIPLGTSTTTLVLADAGKHQYYTGTTTVTIPTNASVAFPIGTAITFVMDHASQALTFTTTSLTVYKAGTAAAWASGGTLSVRGLCTFLKVGTDTWYVSGSGLS